MAWLQKRARCVYNLPFSLTHNDTKLAFSKYNKAVKITLRKDKDSRWQDKLHCFLLGDRCCTKAHQHMNNGWSFGGMIKASTALDSSITHLKVKLLWMCYEWGYEWAEWTPVLEICSENVNLQRGKEKRKTKKIPKPLESEEEGTMKEEPALDSLSPQCTSTSRIWRARQEEAQALGPSAVDDSRCPKTEKSIYLNGKEELSD